MKCGVGHGGQNYQKCPRKLKNGHTISYRGSKGVAPGVKMGGAGGQNGWRRGPGAKGVASGVKKGGAGGSKWVVPGPGVLGSKGVAPGGQPGATLFIGSTLFFKFWRLYLTIITL